MTSLQHSERPHLAATVPFETITTASSHSIDPALLLRFAPLYQKETAESSEKELVSFVDISLRTTEENEKVQEIASDCSFGASFRLGIAVRCDEDSYSRDSGEDFNDRETYPFCPSELEQHYPGPSSLKGLDFVAKEAFDRVVSFAADPPATQLYSLEAETLERLDNVTELSRSFIPAALFKRKKKKRRLKKMSSKGVASTIRNRLSLSGKKSKESNGDSAEPRGRERSNSRSRSHSQAIPGSPGKSADLRRAHSQVDVDDDNSDDEQNGRGRPGIFARIRERSRSRSRSRSRKDSGNPQKEMLVAVTSCKSDGYYNQKAPGSTFKLPRKAPTNLKLFHELAVGVKDAYAAVGATPHKPTEEDKKTMQPAALEGATVLWDFVGNLDFVSVVRMYTASPLLVVGTSLLILLRCLFRFSSLHSWTKLLWIQLLAARSRMIQRLKDFGMLSKKAIECWRIC
jgi:hypothetical protein